MKTLSSNLWVKGKPLHLFSSDCAKLALVKIPTDEFHWRGKSHGTGTFSNPILKPQKSCQKPRSCTSETSLCHQNRHLHHTCLIFSHANIPFPSRPATIRLEWVLKRGCQHPSDKFEILWQVAQNSFSLYMLVLVKNLTNNCESQYTCLMCILS